MPAVRYLTVQDVIWINTRLTGRPQAFRYSDLEEAAYFQYGYGASKDLPRQVAALMSGLSKLAPFADGNRATAFVSGLAFLRLNALDATADDSTALRWFEEALSAATAATRASGEGAEPEEGLEEVVEQILADFPATVRSLLGSDVPVAARV